MCKTNKQTKISKQGLAKDGRALFCHCKQRIFNSLPHSPYIHGTLPGTRPWVVAEEGGDSWHETQRLGTSSQCSSLGTHRIIENWPFHLRPLLSVFAAPGPLLSPSGRPDHLAGRRDAVCRDKSWPMLPVNRAVACTLHLSLNLQSSSRWGNEVLRCAGIRVSLIRFQALVPTSTSNMAAGSLHPASLSPTLFSPCCSEAPASLKPAFLRQSISASSQPRLLPHRYPHR